MWTVWKMKSYLGLINFRGKFIPNCFGIDVLLSQIRGTRTPMSTASLCSLFHRCETRSAHSFVWRLTIDVKSHILVWSEERNLQCIDHLFEPILCCNSVLQTWRPEWTVEFEDLESVSFRYPVRCGTFWFWNSFICVFIFQRELLWVKNICGLKRLFRVHSH